MPGTPPTTPRLGLARFATGDPDQVPIDLNTISDRLDVIVPRFESGLLSARPSTGAGIADRYFWATDTRELYRDAGGGTPTWENVTRRDVPIVTSLPGSPYNGQQILFRPVAGTFLLWPLVYDTSVSDAYKWCVVGQPPFLEQELVTGESRSAAAYGDLTTVGPSVTLPLAGVYDFTLEDMISTPSIAGGFGYASLQFGATVAVDSDALLVQGNAIVASTSRTIRRTRPTAAETVKMVYRGDGTNAASHSRRHLMMRPVRVG